MTLPRRHFLHLAAGAVVLPGVSQIANAQAYPTRPVRIIVGYAPGIAPDVVTRLLAPFLSERLGQQIIVDNRPGAANNIATEAVVRAPADGYAPPRSFDQHLQRDAIRQSQLRPHPRHCFSCEHRRRPLCHGC